MRCTALSDPAALWLLCRSGYARWESNVVSRTVIAAFGAGLIVATSAPVAQSAPASARATAGAAFAAGQPGPTNTGVPAGVQLTVHVGDVTITKAGTVLSGLDIHGTVSIKAANVTIKNSIIRGGALPTHNHCILLATDSRVTNFLIQDSELYPTNVNGYQNDFCGSHFTANRINSHFGVDTLDINGSNVTVENSWLHGTTTYAIDPNKGGHPSHSDNLQITAGSNIKIVNNTMSGGNNSSIQISQDAGTVSNVQISGNWLDRGTCSVHVNDKPKSGLSGVTMSNNVFGRFQTITGCAMLVTTRIGYTVSGNRWTDGTSARVIVYG
jgi:hypothetical protein